MNCINLRDPKNPKLSVSKLSFSIFFAEIILIVPGSGCCLRCLSAEHSNAFISCWIQNKLGKKIAVLPSKFSCNLFSISLIFFSLLFQNLPTRSAVRKFSLLIYCFGGEISVFCQIFLPFEGWNLDVIEMLRQDARIMSLCSRIRVQSVYWRIDSYVI